MSTPIVPTSERERPGRPARIAGALLLGLHGVAHLALYPVADHSEPGADPRFWEPLTLPHDTRGWAARFTLVTAAAAFLAAGVLLAGTRWWRRWSVAAAAGALCSVVAVGLLWNDLRPRPPALWVGPVVSGAIVAFAALASRRSRRPGR